jgi:hypothetical protein
MPSNMFPPGRRAHVHLGARLLDGRGLGNQLGLDEQFMVELLGVRRLGAGDEEATGRKRIEEMRAARAARLDDYLEDWTEHDREQFAELLGRFNVSIGPAAPTEGRPG